MVLTVFLSQKLFIVSCIFTKRIHERYPCFIASYYKTLSLAKEGNKYKYPKEGNTYKYPGKVTNIISHLLNMSSPYILLGHIVYQLIHQNNLVTVLC